MNYIPNAIGKTACGFKIKVVSLMKTNILQEYGKQTVYGNGNISIKLKIQKQSEDNIKSISNVLELKKRK